jgi:hypothetical protein
MAQQVKFDTVNLESKYRRRDSLVALINESDFFRYAGCVSAVAVAHAGKLVLTTGITFARPSAMCFSLEVSDQDCPHPTK